MDATPHPTVGTLLAERAAALVGRDRELAQLDRLLEPGPPMLAYVHGIAGIGKSSLARAFGARARARGATAFEIGGGDVEPTDRGFVAGLGATVGASDAQELMAVLAAASGQVVLIIDAAERLRLLDDWLRRVFVPSLPRNVRVVFTGRERPHRLWGATYGELLLRLPLTGLSEQDVVTLLCRLGVAEDDVAEVDRVARGHPLALHLAAAALARRPRVPVAEVISGAVVEDLAALYLDGLDATTRRALDAAALVRRPTRSALREMLPDLDGDEAFERVLRLPFAELGAEGLVLHDIVREAVDASLRAIDPELRRRLRSAAYRHARGELRAAGPRELWRSTADMLYLVDNPLIRGGFFPPARESHAVDAASSRDAASILAIAARHQPQAVAELIGEWWTAAGASFRVARDADGAVSGVIAMCERRDVPARLIDRDPVAALWRDDLRRDPVGRDDRVLYTRCLLSRDHGEAPSPVQAALWVDAKRAYMELRPRLRRMYVAFAAPGDYMPMLRPLGFTPVRDGSTEIGATTYHSLRLDFGPRSVDGWLAGLVAAETEVEDEVIVDRARRELMVGGRRIALTSLELELVAYLAEREGHPVARSELRREVWGDQWQGGSNVVDVAVSALRRKLGEHAPLIETVRGIGYRMRQP